MIAMTDVVSKEKLQTTSIDNYYRYGVYFYTTGIVLLKNLKHAIAKQYFSKAEVMWKDILYNGDPALNSLYSMIKICDKKI